ncbi:zinc metalloprotease HtpX [Actinomyces vulturis]|uniref:zinc metalloprotease HtpX n=1 Tax=Actinomyces vulturis TaxID=1857645 RepID=UPI00082CB54E|nr:zinc metalloprotease HtpX [Actinomyces vulturis]
MHSTNHHNGLKTLFLIGALWALLIGIGYLIAENTGNPIWIIGFGLLGVGQTAYSYWNSDKLAVSSMNAYPVSEHEQPVMYKVVRELSQKAGQPMPDLFVAPTMSPNAFATGRNPRHAAVCCTEGILHLLNERELRGVLGHELSHVYNRDILTGSVAAGIAGLVGSISSMMLYMGAGRSEDRRNGNPIALLLIALLAPFAATFVRFAVSRTREFDADHDGALLTEDPLALASALSKLSGGVAARPLPEHPKVEPLSAMMIANPFGGLSRNMFATHPPMEERIKRLEEMAGY